MFFKYVSHTTLNKQPANFRLELLARHQRDQVKDVGFIQRSLVHVDNFVKRWLKFVIDPLSQISAVEIPSFYVSDSVPPSY